MIHDNRTHFDRQNVIGTLGEDVVIDYMKSRGNTILERSQGYFPDWDVKIKNQNGAIQTIEVKTDTSTYPNLAIEYKSRNKPSGIYSTKADIYIIYSEKERVLYAARTADLRLWIAEHAPLQKKNTVNDSETYLFIIPKKEFEEYFSTYELN